MPDLNAVPAVRAHFRLQWEPAQNCHVLLYPEGMIKLNESAGEILSCCDGERDIASIIQVLQGKFPEADSLPEDTLEFFEVANEQRWVEFRHS